MEKADLIMHPVRMRMILALSGRTLSAKQLAAEMPEVATATLYHHLGLLTKGGLVQIVEERPVRGTLREKTYTLVQHSSVLSQQEIECTSNEDLQRYFQIFVGGLLGEFSRYLQRDEPRDDKHMGFREVALYLSDEEFQQFIQDIRAALRPWLEQEPAPGRERILFSTVLIPDREGAKTPRQTE